MSAFKDRLKNDIKKVFLNLDQFADWHTIDGKEVQCLVNRENIQPHSPTYEGVFAEVLVIYVAAEDVPVPVVSQPMVLDGEVYPVQAVSVEGDMLVITLDANEQ